MAVKLGHRSLGAMLTVLVLLLATACGGGGASETKSPPSGGTGTPSGGSAANTSSADKAAPASKDAGAAKATQAPPAAPIKMTVAYTSYATQYGPLYVAQEMGLFKKHGLDVELVFIQSSSQATSALVSRSAHIVVGSGEAALTGISKDVKELRIIGQIVPTGFLEVWTQPEINSAKDLEGKTISSTSPGSLGDRLTAVWLRQNGVDPSKVKMVYVGSLSALVASIRSGSAAATLINPPLGEALREDKKKLLTDLRSVPYAAVMYMATDDWAKANSEAIVRMYKATAEATSILKTQPDTVLPILAKWSKTENPDWNKYGYNFYEPVWKPNPRVDLGVVKATQDVSAEADIKAIDTTKYVDNSYVEALEKSGFLSTLPVK